MTKPLVLSQIAATSYGAIIRINTASGIFDVFSWLSKYYLFVCFGHTYASILVNQGVDIVAVSFSLGHSQVSTTSNIYCHMLDNARAKAANAISSVLDTDSGFDAQISK